MSVALVYNPRAGLIRRRPSLLGEVVGTLRKAFGDLALVPTTGPKSAGPLAAEMVARGASTVIVWGGDGTINEAIQSLAGGPATLGVLPGGTACVLTNELGLGVDPVAAARRLEACEPREISAGRMRRADGSAQLFLLMAGVGFDAGIVHRLDLSLKDRVGKLAYWAGALRELSATLDQFDVEIDGISRRCSFVLVSRVRNYGGAIPLVKGASLLSDSFEVVIFRSRNAWLYPLCFLALLSGFTSFLRVLEVHRGTRLAVSPRGVEPIHVQLDGDYAGTIPASFEIVPSVIRLLVPRSFRG